MGDVSFDCTSAPINISPLVEAATISNDFQVSTSGQTGITQITNSIKSTNSIVQTPGPLPILGAAFGMSRKLRRRISSAA